MNDAKQAAKDAIDKMEDLSDADKTAAKANVDKATDISGVNTAKTDAQNLNDAKKAAKEPSIRWKIYQTQIKQQPRQMSIRQLIFQE
ncbi:GA module-containing protein [Lactobacillus jensenii]|uniref:GA module-containing protein n=1 Tax=Lactobacillus jensenii TaxID=109790 RepID=UPI00177CCE7C|nr:GA module-containing protein [Lactobacillus jensenii]